MAKSFIVIRLLLDFGAVFEAFKIIGARLSCAVAGTL